MLAPGSSAFILRIADSIYCALLLAMHFLQNVLCSSFSLTGMQLSCSSFRIPPGVAVVHVMSLLLELIPVSWHDKQGHGNSLWPSAEDEITGSLSQ